MGWWWWWVVVVMMVVVAVVVATARCPCRRYIHGHRRLVWVRLVVLVPVAVPLPAAAGVQASAPTPAPRMTGPARAVLAVGVPRAVATRTLVVRYHVTMHTQPPGVRVG